MSNMEEGWTPNYRERPGVMERSEELLPWMEVRVRDSRKRGGTKTQE